MFLTHFYLSTRHIIGLIKFTIVHMIIYGSRNSVYFSDVSEEKDTESGDDKGNLVVNQL